MKLRIQQVASTLYLVSVTLESELVTLGTISGLPNGEYSAKTNNGEELEDSYTSLQIATHQLVWYHAGNTLPINAQNTLLPQIREI